MPPGDNKIIMSYENIEDKETYNLLEGIVPLRKEEVKFQELNFAYSLYFMKKGQRKGYWSDSFKNISLYSEIGSQIQSKSLNYH